MLLKIFGLLDIVAGLSIILAYLEKGQVFVLFLALIIFIKGIIFLWNWNSIVDVIAAVLMGIAAFGFFYAFTWLAMLWLFQKGIFSLLRSV